MNPETGQAMGGPSPGREENGDFSRGCSDVKDPAIKGEQLFELRVMQELGKGV